MHLPKPEPSYLKQKLLELQRHYPVIAGLMLVSSGGLVLASTFQREDSVSRLAAVSRALYLLSQDICQEFNRGEMRSVHLSFQRGEAGDDNTPSRVVLRPVTPDAILVLVLHVPSGMRQENAIFYQDIERIFGFLAQQITYDGTT